VAGVKERIEHDELLFDSAVVSHGYAPHLRDYHVVVELGHGRWLYRFTHCPEAHVTTAVTDEAWRHSWDEQFTDYEAWEEAGAPEGFVWGVCWAEAYPGISYVDGSERARRWSERLAHEMHEAAIETNAFRLGLVFHDLVVEQIGHADP
jgi:hypothetical protein